VEKEFMVIAASLMATLHHLAAFTLTACLVYEFIAFRQSLTAGEVRRIQRVDLWYGISAGVLLIAGLLRVFIFEKGANFYATNPLFWVKMASFALVGLLSIYPTIRYIRWGKPAEDKLMEVPADEHRRIRLLLNLEMIGLALILFVAPAMARAIGMN
jgi:putative membrane protein